MAKVDLSPLEDVTSKEIRRYNKLVGEILDRKRKYINEETADAIAFFYLKCYELENKKRKRSNKR